MNRRRFITSSIMGAGLVAVCPSFALSNTNTSHFSKFKYLMNKGKYISVANLSKGIQDTFNSLTTSLKNSDYEYSKTQIIKLNSTSYAVPLVKKSLLSSPKNEMALIVGNTFKSKFYILNEYQTSEFNLLINNYENNLKANKITNLSVSEFAFPVSIVKESKGKENLLAYKNLLNNEITISSLGKKSKAVIS
ncbi:hypothetical protein [Tenacibaculum jejuense]|uniref:Uncharacterized protein n=1 Tax=Tenacibaculum jejuense TaxID=584609 RepID=A0A238U816_9FLAO|nr:hypothetical protein [Tenacibaculum jejuense]SNR15146.1 conserved exported protein of unknown function [Tenacibaculum jejuense]